MAATDALSRKIQELGQWTPESLREGGAVEFTDAGRKLVITAYQQRKQKTWFFDN